MMLLTKANRDALPALGTTEDVPMDKKVAVVKFFQPWGSWTWWAVEGSQEGDDFTFFGLVEGFEREWGYFSLNELQSVKGPFGLGIERDLHWKPGPVPPERGQAAEVQGFGGLDLTIVEAKDL